MHKVATATLKNELEREGRRQQSWTVPVKFAEVIVALRETVQEKDRAGVPAALSLGVVGFGTPATSRTGSRTPTTKLVGTTTPTPNYIPLLARKTDAEVATSPPLPGFSSPLATTKVKYSSPPPSTPATPGAHADLLAKLRRQPTHRPS